MCQIGQGERSTAARRVRSSASMASKCSGPGPSDAAPGSPAGSSTSIRVSPSHQRASSRAPSAERASTTPSASSWPTLSRRGPKRASSWPSRRARAEPSPSAASMSARAAAVASCSVPPSKSATQRRSPSRAARADAASGAAFIRDTIHSSSAAVAIDAPITVVPTSQP